MLDAEEGERLGGVIEALGRLVRAGAEGIALENLMPGDLGLDEFFRLILENVAAMVGAEMILLALVFGMALAQRQRVARLGEHHRNMADLALHRHGRRRERLYFRFALSPIFIERRSEEQTYELQ